MPRLPAKTTPNDNYRLPKCLGLTMLLFCLLAPSSAVASKLYHVAASIPPVGALVRYIAGDRAVTDVLLDPAASPHQTSLRPSQLRLVSGSDLIVQVGSGLEPWLDRIETPTGSSRILLSQSSGTLRLPLRAKASSADGDAGVDPHMWLDPQVIAHWLPVITKALVARDPENAAYYTRRSDTGVLEILRIEADLANRLNVLDLITLIFAHDGFQYFENRFGLHAAGVLARADGVAPGVASLRKLTRAVAGAPVCVIHDATQSPKLAKSVFPDAVHVTFDLLGRDIAPDANWLPVFFDQLAAALESCAK